MKLLQPKVWNKRDASVPAGAIYVGRPSKWGNPFSHVLSKYDDIVLVGTREEAIQSYYEMIAVMPHFIQQIREELRGKHLVCWCAPLPCHADILLKIANDL